MKLKQRLWTLEIKAKKDKTITELYSPQSQHVLDIEEKFLQLQMLRLLAQKSK